VIGRLLPFLLFILLAVLLAAGLTIADRKTEIPSPLIGKPVPEFSLPLLGQETVVMSQADFAGRPYLLNVWASWCVTCRVEHPVITALAKSGKVRVIGLNYRDATEDAQAWLEQFGNPYELNLADTSGRTAIDFGVYAAPESFLISADGTILYKQIGALTPEAIEQEILPRLENPATKGKAP
jgi:cytochrome c biogenesis protein CcmG/thiol:disulfide interchange protein DsbE